ncbi:polysaccharide biosynthesis tyrosine autokinase [Blastococcus haudaquaticus]|uniref:Capsular exopolysaccharide family n=1 Tax=Blastococcus haudaquaticus TaxID=1938745 RepID=A0A286GY00_9ACTN|nr:polysaccharide biosynthesis tyrosine autokinase [Blastococcus haudaquaticus]SOE00417.1 capsular exopolysaccharide family [Blastococcus haudaquaticus]
MGISRYAGSLLRRWYYLVIGLALGAAAAAGVLQLMTPQYASNTQLFVSTAGATDLSAVAQGEQFSQQRAASYAQLLIGRDLAALVIADLGLETTPDQLPSQISAQVLPETVILDVTVTDESPERALAIARSVGEQFSALVERLETPRGAAVAPVQVSVVAAPLLPSEPASPDPVRILAAGMFAGLLLGGLGAVARDRLDTSVREESEVTDAARVPVLGAIPDLVSRDVRIAEVTTGPVAEAYRLVRTNLKFVSVDARPRVLMVTSADQSEGKTTTTIQLGMALAQAGQNVLLIEADLRRPRLTRQLGLVAGAGLTSVLTETADVEDVLQPQGTAGLTVLAAGATPPNPGELLASDAMATLLGKLAESYDVVLVDAAPLLPVADSAGLAALVDGVILTVRWGSTPVDRLRRCRELLDRAGVAVLGAVLTFAPRRTARNYYYDGDDASTGWFRRTFAGRGRRNNR